MSSSEFDSGDALFAFDEKLRLVLWNVAAERVTGYRAQEVLGRSCWEVLRGTDEAGARVCRPSCRYARLMKLGATPSGPRLLMRTKSGARRRVSFSMLTVRDDGQPRYLHLIRLDDGAARDREEPAQVPELTGRQLEVLELAGAGLSGRAIAARLGIAETTVRNHLTLVAFKLDCSTRAQAVERARRLGLIPSPGGRTRP